MKKINDENIFLTANKREIFGKKIKKLRAKNIIPANVFGANFKSTAISINEKEFKKNYRLLKNKPFFYIELKKELIPVIIHQIQTHPLTNFILHIDFRRVDLKEKIKVEVPVKIRGNSEAIEKKGCFVLQQKDKLTIESLPKNIPSIIEVSIDKLKEIGDEIRVKDLPKNSQYEIEEEPETVIISVVAHKEEKISPEQPEVEIQPEIPEEGKESNIITEEKSAKKTVEKPSS